VPCLHRSEGAERRLRSGAAGTAAHGDEAQIIYSGL
jgi:hypothetical protein